MTKSILEFIAQKSAKEFVKGMPDKQFKKFCKLPQKDLEMMIGKVYELLEPAIKDSFIKITIEELKERAKE